MSIVPGYIDRCTDITLDNLPADDTLQRLKRLRQEFYQEATDERWIEVLQGAVRAMILRRELDEISTIGDIDDWER